MSHVPSGAEQAGAKETEVSRHPSGILTETSCRGPTGAASRFLSRQAFTRPGDLRNIQLRFSVPPDHDNHMDPGSLRPVLAPLSTHSSPMRCADGVVHTVQFAGDLHLTSRTAQSLALPAHVIPCPKLLCALRQLVDLLRLSRSGCATTNTNNQLLRATSHIIALILPSPWGPVWLANPLFTAQRSANIRLPTLRSHPGSPSITLYLSIRSSL